MSFKKNKQELTFADLEIAFQNRTLQTLTELNNTVSWDRIESLLIEDYPVGH